MKSLSGLTILSVLGISACTGPPEVGKLDPRPQTKTSPLDKLDAEKIPEETRKLLAVPELVAFIAAHDRAVGALAFSPDGKRLASSGWDNIVTLWDMTDAEPQEVAKLEGSPSSVAFIADGKKLVTGGPERRVVLWDITGDKPKLHSKLGGHKASPFAIQAAPNGMMLASGSLNPLLRVWRFDVVDAEIWAVLPGESAAALGVSSLSFSSDSKLLAAGHNIGKPSLRIWDVSGDAMEEHTFPATQARIVQFSSKAPLLAFAADDAVVHIWSLAGKERKSMHDLKGHAQADQGPAIKALAFTPDGSVLASGGQDRRVILWDGEKGETKRALAFPEEIRALAFAPDGRHLAVGSDDGTILILRLKW